MKTKLLLPLLLTFGSAAFASPTFLFTLSPTLQQTLGDGITPAIFTGTLTYTALDDSFLFLNDISVTFDAPGLPFLSVDPTGQPPSVPNTFFFNTAPGDLIGDGVPTDDSYTGPIFEVFAAPGTPLGQYTGTINILGGADPSDLTILNTTPVQFTVEITPEPTAWSLMLLGLAGLAALAWKRRVVDSRGL